MLRIVTDGAVDMPASWQEDFQIEIIPINIRFGEEEYQSGKNLTSKVFYQLVKIKKMIPKTSLPSPAQIIDFYRAIANKGDTILSIHLASKMSGTFSTVQLAAKDLLHEFNIYTFDSGAGSAALGFMCREARQMDRQGISVQSILARLDDTKKRLAISFTLDTVDFAYMSGRINKLQNVISSVLKIKPIIILKDGLLMMGEKVRTRQRSIDRVIAIIKEKVGNGQVHIAVVHAADLETADYLVEQVKSELNVHEIIITELAIPIAANLGPGTVGVIAYPVLDKSNQ